jgi:hypothetical protein
VSYSVQGKANIAASVNFPQSGYGVMYDLLEIMG